MIFEWCSNVDLQQKQTGIDADEKATGQICPQLRGGRLRGYLAR